MKVFAIKDKTAVVVVVSYRNVKRIPVRFKTLICMQFVQLRRDILSEVIIPLSFQIEVLNSLKYLNSHVPSTS